MAIDYRLNSKVECLHGSIKDREVVMRGKRLFKMPSQVAEVKTNSSFTVSD
jgi:hypothetical protein